MNNAQQIGFILWEVLDSIERVFILKQSLRLQEINAIPSQLLFIEKTDVRRTFATETVVPAG